ncbi:MAG: hypothetical protein ACYTG7_00885 [Planctomycetota bacterium]
MALLLGFLPGRFFAGLPTGRPTFFAFLRPGGLPLRLAFFRAFFRPGGLPRRFLATTFFFTTFFLPTFFRLAFFFLPAFFLTVFFRVAFFLTALDLLETLPTLLAIKDSPYKLILKGNLQNGIYFFHADD